MPAEAFKRKAQVGAGVLMLPVGVYLIYYIYESLSRFISRSFTHPEWWYTHWMVDEGIKAALATRTLYFVGWMPIIIVSAMSTIAGLYLLNRIRKGLFFDLHTGWAIQMLGGLSVVTIILDTIMEAVSVVLITSQNADGGLPFRYQYDPTDIKMLILSIVIFIIGWIMREAIMIDQENREYV